MFIDGKPATVLLDTGSEVTQNCHDYCKEHRIEIHPFSHIINIERTGGDTMDSLGYSEAKLSLSIGKKMFETNASLFVLLTTGHYRRVPVSLGNSITDLVTYSLETSNFGHASQSWEGTLLYYTNQEASLVTAIPERDCEDY